MSTSNRDGRDASAEVSMPAIIDSLLEGCQIIDFDWRYKYVNDTVVRHGRLSREKLLGHTMMKCYPGIESTPMFTVLRQCMRDRIARQLQNRFTYPDGSEAWFELRFEPVPEGVFILSIDISERKQAEERINHLNAVLRGIRKVNQLITRETDRDRLIDGACHHLLEARSFKAVTIVLTDPSDRQVKAYARSGESLALLDSMLKQGEIPDCGCLAMATRQPVARMLGDPACRGCSVSEELEINRRNMIVPLLQGGKSHGFMLVCLPDQNIDLPEEQRLMQEIADDIAFALSSIETKAERDKSAEALAVTEAQLQQAQKLESIGRLAGGIAHDFNNILAAQLAYCELMQNRLPADRKLASGLEKVRQCAERAAGLTRQLLAFSRKQALQVEVVDLNEVVTNIEKMLGRLIGEDVALKTVPAADLQRIKADPGQIEQVIMNLAVNARDAMPQGGHLTIETANVELDEAYVRNHADSRTGPHVMLAVTDTGSGMDAATREHLFEPFFTTKERGKGTGLGLATVYGIVKQSGGNIWIYSEPGAGTTFKVYFPATNESATQHQPRRHAAIRGGGEHVLLVEDDGMLREIFAKMIAEFGYHVDSAADGEAALAMVEGGDAEPDLLLTDVIMPGLSGKQLAGRLSEIRPGLKVLYTSGYTDNTIVHHGILDNDVTFLQKPFNGADLANKIRQLLDSEPA